MLDQVEKKAVSLKNNPPEGKVMEVGEHKIFINIPMEQPLFSPPAKTELLSKIEMTGDDEIDTEKLFDLVYMDRDRLEGNIRTALSEQEQEFIQFGHIIRALEN